MKKYPVISFLLIGTAIAAMAGPFSEDIDGVTFSEPLFEGWIHQVTYLHRPQATSGGFSRDESGTPSNAPPTAALSGKPNAFDGSATTQHILSLGNGGTITLSFHAPITDGPGPDFAIFENAFTDFSDYTGSTRASSTSFYTFAELAYVDIATTTSHWARFTSTYQNTETLYALNNIPQNYYASQDVTHIDGLAGKHIISEGTPFDLSTLTNHPAILNGSVNLSDINYIRLTDVIGDGTTTDSSTNAIYDPYYDFIAGHPNPAAPSQSDGFDLRAIGIIHHQTKLTIDPTTITWTGHTNASYQLQYTHNLTSTNWINLGPTQPGTNGPITYLHSNAATRIYRVKKTK